VPFDKPAKFNKRTTEHIIQAVQRVEAMPYPARQPIYFPRFGGDAGVFDAITTSTVTPFNSNTNTYGQGTCATLIATFNSNTNTYLATPNNSVVNSNSNVLLNGYTNNGNSINSGIKITVAPFCGVFILIGADQC